MCVVTAISDSMKRLGTSWQQTYLCIVCVILSMCMISRIGLVSRLDIWQMIGRLRIQTNLWNSCNDEKAAIIPIRWHGGICDPNWSSPKLAVLGRIDVPVITLQKTSIKPIINLIICYPMCLNHIILASQLKGHCKHFFFRATQATNNNKLPSSKLVIKTSFVNRVNIVCIQVLHPLPH